MNGCFIFVQSCVQCLWHMLVSDRLYTLNESSCTQFLADFCMEMESNTFKMMLFMDESFVQCDSDKLMC